MKYYTLHKAVVELGQCRMTVEEMNGPMQQKREARNRHTGMQGNYMGQYLHYKLISALTTKQPIYLDKIKFDPYVKDKVIPLGLL